eukprot:Rmarinus@m.7354
MGEQNGSYKYYTYASMVRAVKDLSSAYPELIRISTAYSKFGLPQTGQCKSVSDDVAATTEPCDVWIIEVSDFSSLNASSPPIDWVPIEERAEVFLSGALHGNEIVGPTVSVELAAFLAFEAYEDTSTGAWIRNLLRRRVITIVPAANAPGFDGCVRAELGIDPNRDFAFDQKPSDCMVTNAARSINELYLNHLYQIAVTFHGGDNLIAYQWGNQAYCDNFPKKCRSGWIAPDNYAMKQIGEAMSSYAGGVPRSDGPYRVGPLNDPSVIYPVAGGMEDWSYGASWDSHATTCSPKRPNSNRKGHPDAPDEHYDAEKTTYGDSTHRCPMFLVEAANNKKPAENELGLRLRPFIRSDVERPTATYSSGSDVLLAHEAGGQGDGHVARNIRLSLLAIDVAQPYVYLNSIPTTDDLRRKSDLTFQWSVGGAFTVDATHVVCELLHLNDIVQKSPGNLNVIYIPSTALKRDYAAEGSTYSVSPTGPHMFSTTLEFDALEVAASGADPDGLRCIARAQVDSAWGDSEPTATPPLKPQSHLVASRTDATWRHEINGHKIIGRLYWESEAVTISLRDGAARQENSDDDYGNHRSGTTSALGGPREYYNIAVDDEDDVAGGGVLQWLLGGDYHPLHNKGDYRPPHNMGTEDVDSHRDNGAAEGG